MSWYVRWGILTTLLLPVMARGDDTKAQGIEGTWKVVSLDSDGEAAPPTVIEKWRWVIRDGKIQSGEPAQDDQRSSYKLDERTEPKAMDMTLLGGKRKGKTFKCIYKTDGETLTICIPEGKRASEDESRPTEFDGGEGKSLIMLKRVKEKGE
jgi:uncharacterized protein (TIGR03067 family)